MNKKLHLNNFNSTMVRLKVSYASAVILRRHNFNSTMVRLKGYVG